MYYFPVQLCSRLRALCTLKKFYCTVKSTPKVAIVGSGPAAFYCAQTLLRSLPNCSIDMFEKLPVPFGLVRFGVAPDHPEVKNCIHQFETLISRAENRFGFHGNVSVGKDVSVPELLQAFHILVLAYGAPKEQELEIRGAREARNYFSARQFVGWYNGFPDNRDLQPNLDTESVVILGHGNVALDVARILLLPLNMLKETDVSDHALHMLQRSKVKHVTLVGRRGPLQVAFTIKEVRELVSLQDAIAQFDMRHFDTVEQLIDRLPRPRKRLTQLLLDTAKRPQRQPTIHQKSWTLKFCRSPVEILHDNGLLRGIRLQANQLSALENPMKPENIKCTPIPDLFETVECGLVLSSIGYRSVNIDPAIPFDTTRAVVKTDLLGRVEGLAGAYAVGWCGRGPVGVLAATQIDGSAVAKTIAADVATQALDTSAAKQGAPAVEALLRTRGVRAVSWSDWQKIDRLEQRRGQEVGKPREKLVSNEELMRVVQET